MMMRSTLPPQKPETLPDGHACCGSNDDDGQAYGNGNPGAVKDTGENVPSHFISTEEMMKGRCLEPACHVHEIGVPGTDKGRQKSQQDNEGHNDHACQGELVLQKDIQGFMEKAFPLFPDFLCLHVSHGHHLR